jgi:hypothetical protein
MRIPFGPSLKLGTAIPRVVLGAAAWTSCLIGPTTLFFQA